MNMGVSSSARQKFVKFPTISIVFLSPLIISSVIRRPAMLAVINDTKQPETKARKATAVMDGLRSGASALKAPIMMPMELGFAKPQMA
jgi:hypothetical protein